MGDEKKNINGIGRFSFKDKLMRLLYNFLGMLAKDTRRRLMFINRWISFLRVTFYKVSKQPK